MAPSITVAKLCRSLSLSPRRKDLQMSSTATAPRNWKFSRQRVVVAFVLVAILVVGWILWPTDEKPSTDNTPTPPNKTMVAPVVPSLLEDLQFVAERFPHLQLHTEAFTVAVEVLDEQTVKDLQAGAKEALKYDGIEIDGDVKFERATILLDASSSRIVGFNAVVTGTKQGGDPLGKRNVYIEDETRNVEQSAKLAKDLRSEVKKVRIYSPSTAGAGNRVRLKINVPRSRLVVK